MSVLSLSLFPGNHVCSSHCCCRKPLCANTVLALNLCSHRKGLNIMFQRIVFRRAVGGLRNSSDGNGCESIGQVAGTSGTERVPAEPINVLVRSIQFRVLSSVLTHFWEKHKSWYLS